MKKPRSTAEHIATSATLAEIRAHAARLGDATEALDGHLGPALAGHASVARLDLREVSLIADTAAWATRLRFVAPDLARFFAGYLRLVEAPRIRIHVGRPRAQVAQDRRQPISPRSAQLLGDTARHIEDPRLSAVLARLARHARSRVSDTEDG